MYTYCTIEHYFTGSLEIGNILNWVRKGPKNYNNIIKRIFVRNTSIRFSGMNTFVTDKVLFLGGKNRKRQWIHDVV